jgi:basic membrane protein A and related proteins
MGEMEHMAEKQTNEANLIYDAAVGRGKRAYRQNIAGGRSGYLPALEGLLENADIVKEVELGEVEIPLKKVVGTYYSSRGNSFSANFMPLLDSNTEFCRKWILLCHAHLTEGIKYPIKVYEYLNWYYVVEGNKRVSILKYFDAPAITGKVTRLVPRWDENDPDIRLYHEFLHFYTSTGVNFVWLSFEESYGRLLEYIKSLSPKNSFGRDTVMTFKSAYFNFRSTYYECGGGNLDVTTGDAFLEFLKIYGWPDTYDEQELRDKIIGLMVELRDFFNAEKVIIEDKPERVDRGVRIPVLQTPLKRKKKLKVAFVYEGSLKESNWTHGHELGRQKVSKILEDSISTVCLENVPEGMEAYESIKRLAQEGSEVIFTVSPSFFHATLRAALEFKKVRFLNCSEMYSYKHVRTYFGRMHEPRFLSGLIAGTLTQTNILGYIGTFQVPGVVAGINAFTLGARLVNPKARVYVEWTGRWDVQQANAQATTKLMKAGADFTCHHNTYNFAGGSEFGLYSMECAVEGNDSCRLNHIAAPLWNWGVFYEKILQDLLHTGIKPVRTGAPEDRYINYWWGMESGVVGFFYSAGILPVETRKLVEHFKRTVCERQFNPFAGPVYDGSGVLRIEDDRAAEYYDIANMNWFVEGVETVVPKEAMVWRGPEEVSSEMLDA